LDEAHSLQQDCRNIKPIFTERNTGVRTPPQTTDNKIDEFKSVSQSPGSPMQPRGANAPQHHEDADPNNHLVSPSSSKQIVYQRTGQEQQATAVPHEQFA
jgi:hypothetical protein